jgi:phospholipid-binding lipoprotein MlaA
MTKHIILITVIGLFFFSSFALSDDSIPLVTPSCDQDEVESSSQGVESISAQNEPAQESDESVVEPDKEVNPSGQGEATEEKEETYIADPLAPWNKAMYHVNDKFYYWLLKPATQGYSAVFPEGMRVSFSNFYENAATPIRFVNNLLQLKIKSAGNELVRFVANTLFGVVGFGDFAKEKMDIKRQDEDLGKTFAHYGIGHGFYIVWPVLGPSSLRDSVGFVGDRFLHPFGYLSPTDISFGASAGLYAHEQVNSTSFHIGDYEDFTKAAVDPYVSMRDAYAQHRQMYP